MNFFLAAGVMAWPLLALTIVIVGLILRAVSRAPENAESILFAILFWGFTAAVLGFLGQCAGLYNALTVISSADAVDPHILARGFAESFSTTLWGSGLLIVSGLAWFVLRALKRTPPQPLMSGTR